MIKKIQSMGFSMRRGKTLKVWNESYLFVLETGKNEQSRIKEIHGVITYDTKGNLLDTTCALPVAVRSDFYYDEIACLEGKVTACFNKNKRNVVEIENFDAFYRECFDKVRAANPELIFVYPGLSAASKKTEEKNVTSPDAVLLVKNSLGALKSLLEKVAAFKKELTQVRKGFSQDLYNTMLSRMDTFDKSFEEKMIQVDVLTKGVAKKKQEPLLAERSHVYSEYRMLSEECKEILNRESIKPSVTIKKEVPAVAVQSVGVSPESASSDIAKISEPEITISSSEVKPAQSELERLELELKKNQEEYNRITGCIQAETGKTLLRLQSDPEKLKQLVATQQKIKNDIRLIKEQIAILNPTVVQSSRMRFQFKPPAAPMSMSDIDKLPLGSQLTHLQKIDDTLLSKKEERDALRSKITAIEAGLRDKTLFVSPLAEAFLRNKPKLPSIPTLSSSNWSDVSNEPVI